MSANRGWITILLAGLVLLTSSTPAASDPCCIITVPPVTPPPPDSGSSLPPEEIYAQLPLFAAIEKQAFGSLRVTIVRASLGEGLARVIAAQGTLGLAPLNTLALQKEKPARGLEIAAVMINKPYYALYTSQPGTRTVGDLKGKQISIPSEGSLAHLYTIDALRAAGLSEKDVKFVTMSPEVTNVAVLAGKAGAVPLFIGTEVAEPRFRQIVGPKPNALPSWVLYASSLTLDKEGKEVAQLIKGLTEGIRIAKTDKELVRTILARQFKISDAKAQDLIVGKYVPLLLPDTIEPNPKEIEQILNILPLTGQIEKPPVLFYTNRLQQLY